MHFIINIHMFNITVDVMNVYVMPFINNMLIFINKIGCIILSALLE
jgi:hypothetical protein